VSRFRRFGGTWGALLLLAAAVRAGDDPLDQARDLALAESRAVADAAERVLPSVAAIRALGKGRDGYGAGIVVAPEGLVLTALHVVKEASALAAVVDGEEFPARLVGTHVQTDIALLRIVAPGRTFRAARFAPDDEIRVGETVLAVANPFGLGTSVTRGILSARDRRGVVEGNDAPLLQTDASINPGSSGGALVNLRGEVVGLITAILTRSGGSEGVGFAVPSLELETVAHALAEGREVLRPWLGIRVTRTTSNRPGLKVLAVTPGGPCAAAGLRRGDLITRLANRPLRLSDELHLLLRHQEIGDRVQLEVLREGREFALDVEVGGK